MNVTAVPITSLFDVEGQTPTTIAVAVSTERDKVNSCAPEERNVYGRVHQYC